MTHIERQQQMVEYYDKSIPVKAAKIEYGKLLIETIVEGLIEEYPYLGSGVWGYGGDSVAVKINGEYYPSMSVILLN